MFENIEQLEQQVKEFQKNILASTALLKSLEELTAAVKQQQVSYDQSAKSLIENMEQDRAASKEQADELTSTVSRLATNATDDIARNNNELLSDFRSSIASYDTTVKGLLDKLAEDRTALNKQAEQILSSMEKQAQSIPENVAKENATLIEQIRQSINDYDKLMKATLEHIKSDNQAISDDAIKAYGELNRAHIEQLEQTSEQVKGMIEQLALRYKQFLERLDSTNIDQLFTEVQKMKKSLEAKMTIILAGVGITAVIAVVSLFVR